MIGGTETNKEDGYQWELFLKNLIMELLQVFAILCHAMLLTVSGKLSKVLKSMISQEKECKRMKKSFLKKEKWLWENDSLLE